MVTVVTNCAYSVLEYLRNFISGHRILVNVHSVFMVAIEIQFTSSRTPVRVITTDDKENGIIHSFILVRLLPLCSDNRFIGLYRETQDVRVHTRIHMQPRDRVLGF